MENYIDLINAYLSETLSELENLAFETRLKTDSEFMSIYEEHIVILNGLERINTIKEINNAKQNYIRSKWLKYLGISIVIIMISILAYSVITKSQNIENSDPPVNSTIKSVSDSTKVENEVSVKITSDTILSEKIMPKPRMSITLEKQVLDVTYEKDSFEFINSDENSIIPFLKSFEKAPQKVLISIEDDFEVILKEGTKISIPKNAFIYEKTREQVFGEINLEVKEYYKLSDILLANLSTKSDDKLLETGGMLFIEASKNGSKLKLKPNKKLNIIFNNNGKENMQLFKGEEIAENINWRLNGKLNSNVIDELTGEIEEAEQVAISQIEVPFNIEKFPTYNDCEDLDKDCTINKIIKFLSRKFNTDLISGRQRISVIIKVDEAGNVIDVISRNNDPILEAEIKRVLMDLPKMTPAKKNGKTIASRLLFPIVLSDGVDELLGVKSQTGSFFISGKFGSADGNYSLSSAKLGWINCDRFVNSRKKKIKYKLKIKDADGANVKMIFRGQ